MIVDDQENERPHHNPDSLELVGDMMTLPRFRPGFI